MHLTFDQWENEQDVSKRDKRKCMMPDPNHCGRSPTALGIDSIDILELSGDLFARKFVDSYDSRVKDAIDASRKIEEAKLNPNRSLDSATSNDSKAGSAGENMKFEGHGTLIVATETLHTGDPLCLGLGPAFSHLRLVPCFQDSVTPTLAENWETGAVILEEVQEHTRWSVGPCSSNGGLERLYVIYSSKEYFVVAIDRSAVPCINKMTVVCILVSVRMERLRSRQEPTCLQVQNVSLL